MHEFHESQWEHRLELAERFHDARLRKLAQRVAFCHAAETLPVALRSAHEAEFARRLLSKEAEWLTLPKAKEQSNELLNSADEEQKAFLQEPAA